MVDYLTLVGDASDNIRGREGHRTEDGRRACLELFGNLDDVYAALDRRSMTASLKPAQVDRASMELRPRLDTAFRPAGNDAH